MPVLQCRESFETRLALIDAQHRQLFETLEGLAGALDRGASATEVTTGLAALARHAIRHCQTEETLMKDMAFPGRIPHADQHQDLIRQLRDLEYRHLKGGVVDPGATASLGAWLEHHIGESDGAYADHLRAHQGA